MPNINISLPQRYAEALETKRLQDESLGVCAKRLLLALLDGEIEPSPPPATLAPTPPATSPSELLEIKQRLMKLEEAHRRTILDHDDESASGEVDRLAEIEERLKSFEQALTIDTLTGERAIRTEERVQALETLLEERWENIVETNEGVNELSERINDIESAMLRIIEREAALLFDPAPDERIEELEGKVENLNQLVRDLVAAGSGMEEMEIFRGQIENRWVRLTSEIVALKDRLSAIESPATEEPKRRGRPPKSDQKT